MMKPILWAFILMAGSWNASYHLSQTQIKVLGNACFAQDSQRKPLKEVGISAIQRMEKAIKQVLANPKMDRSEARTVVHMASYHLETVFKQEAKDYEDATDSYTRNYLENLHAAKHMGWMAEHLITNDYRPGSSPLEDFTVEFLGKVLKKLQHYSRTIKNLDEGDITPKRGRHQRPPKPSAKRRSA